MLKPIFSMNITLFIYHVHLKKHYIIYWNYIKNPIIINVIPIYINEETILFPVTQKRAPIKYFINARNIIGIHSSIHTTMIVFEDGTTIELNIPYTLVTKKWQESLTVGHIIEKTTFY